MIKKTKIILLSIIILAALALASCSGDIFAEKTSVEHTEIQIKSLENVKVEGKNILISQGGEYTLSGSGNDVKVTIDCSEPVKLIFKELNIVNDEKTAINIVSENDVTIQINEKSKSSIVLSSKNDGECIKAQSDLNIAGEGELYLKGYNGIKSKEELSIYAALTVSSFADAIKADKVIINSKSLNIECAEDCIQANEVQIDGGNIVLIGNSDESCGIYAESDAFINNGSININTIDDCIYADDTIIVKGGNIIADTSDDAMHGDKLVEITGGNIAVNSCYEGLESGLIKINGGAINIKSINDGINAAFNDKDSNESADIYISGGSINVDADGDGLDANGSIYIDGGTLFVSGAYGGDNNAIDFDDDFVINGGVVIAAGNNIKSKPASTKSEQNSVMIMYEKIRSESDTFILLDESKNALITANFPKPYETLIVSSDKLKLNAVYHYGTAVYEDLENSYLIDTQVADNELKNTSMFKMTRKIMLLWADK